MTKPAIVVDQVTKEFRLHTESRNSLKERFVRGAPKGTHTFKALDNVSFEVPRGSTFGLIGHNGSGKSTMLKLLAGVYRPTKGKLWVDGRVSALLELGAGFHGELTGRENIRLNGAILGFSRAEIDRQMAAIIDFADIGEFIDAPVKVYSSGMYVRLGFAIAVMLDPEVLIVDEIIAVGDEEFQRKCFDYLFKLRQQGVTIALVTHSMAIARELCDTAVWLEQGVEQSIGPVGPIIEKYLESVNLAEAEEYAAKGHVAVDGGAHGHRGSGEARVMRVEVLDADGQPVPFVQPGDSVTLRFQLRAVQPLSGVTVGMGIITENGVFLSGANSKEGGIEYDVPTGSSYIDLDLPSMILQPGSYRIAASISRKGQTFDYSPDVDRLTVRARTPELEPGLFRMRGDWSGQVRIDS